MGSIVSLALGGWNIVKLGFGAVGSFLSKLNAQGVCGLVVCLGLTLLWLHQWGETLHWKKQSSRFETLYNADEDGAKKLAVHALALKARIDALSANISQTLKDKHDAEDARIIAHADALELRGSGKAACPGHSGLPAGTSGHQQTSSPAPTPAAGLPPADWAAVPWPWLVQLTREHDELLDEAKTWRENDRQQRRQRLTTSPDKTGQTDPQGATP